MKYHIRRKDKEITDKADMDKILLSSNYITLAMVDDTEPYLVSLSHAYEAEKNRAYIHMADEGKKVDLLRKNPKVWGQALLDHGYDQGECSHLYASVMFKGKVSFIEDVEDKKHAFRLMVDQIEPNQKDRERFATSSGIPKTTVAYIEIEFMTGKKSESVKL